MKDKTEKFADRAMLIIGSVVIIIFILALI
jgi:hypothetical protein